MSKPKDDTVGQPRRATDSRPRPGSGTPEAKPAERTKGDAPSAEDGDREPSASWSPIDPGRPVEKK
jgi:hypothetical protein